MIFKFLGGSLPLFNSFKKDQLTGAIAISADAVAGLIKVILLSASYTPDIDSHTRYGQVSAHEVSVAGSPTGYPSGGQAVSASLAFSTDTANDRAAFDAGDITWSSSTITARYAVLVKVRSAGLNKDLDNLIGYIDFGSNQSSSNGNFTIQWDSLGILLLS